MGIGETILWIVLSIFKFLFTPSAMVAAEYTYWETIITTLIGASLGVFIFYFAGAFIFNWIDRVRGKRSKKKKFTRVNRGVVRIKSRFGLGGLVATIGIISVPICSMLAARYFRDNPRTLPALLISVTAWTFGLSALSFLVKNFFH